MPSSGVVRVAPGAIRDSIKVVIDKVLQELPKGKNTIATLDVSLTDGVNVVIAHRQEFGEWEVIPGGYIGKNWDGQWQGGISVTLIR